MAPALGLAVCAVLGLAQWAVAQGLALPSPGATVSLARPWRFHTGDDPAWARPELDDSAWQELTLARSWGHQGHRGYSGVAWYRLAVQLPPQAAVRPADLRLGVTLGRIACSYELYAGGRLLGGMGALPPSPRPYYDRHGTYQIPAAAFDASGRLVLALRVWKAPEFPDSYGGPDGGPFLIGPIEALTRRELLSELPQLMLCGIFLVAAVYHLLLYRRRTQAPEYLWFSLLGFDVACYCLLRTQWKYLLTDQFELLKEAEYFVLYLSPALFLQFTFAIVSHRPGALLRAYQWSHVALGLLVALTPGLRLNLLTLHPWEAWVIPAIAVTLGLIVQRTRTGHREARTIGLGMLAASATFAVDMAGDWLGLGWPRVIYAGFAACLFSMAVSLSNRFSRVYRELDALNQDLERRVFERTQELGRTNTSLTLEKKRVEEALGEAERLRQTAMDAKAEADDANRAKSVFLANMSHELRTPLNGVLGFAQLMDRRSRRDGEDHRHLGAILRSGEHLLQLINDVLSLSKIEAGRITLEEKPFDLSALLRGLDEMFRVRADARGLWLRVESEANLPRAVLGDEGRLRQILINLLSNGLKYTALGGITLRAGWADGRARLEVEDTGPGIAPGEQKALFEPFVQTESGRSSKEGTGLGLALSRQLARLMGGDITLESQLGRGSCFRVEAKLEAAPALGVIDPGEQRRVVGLAAGQPRHRVLVADDVPDNRTLLSGLLASVGFEVKEAASGEEAVTLWREWQPHFIWMDKRMPKLDGLMATQRIREEERQRGGGRVPIVALSASAFEHEREEILAAGCDEFVTKPFRESVIFARMAERLGIAYTYEEPQPEAAAALVPPALTVDRLGSLPAAWLVELQRALTAGDLKRANRLAREIEARDVRLAQDVGSMLRGFQLDELEALLERASAAGAKPRPGP